MNGEHWLNEDGKYLIRVPKDFALLHGDLESKKVTVSRDSYSMLQGHQESSRRIGLEM